MQCASKQFLLLYPWTGPTARTGGNAAMWTPRPGYREPAVTIAALQQSDHRPSLSLSIYIYIYSPCDLSPTWTAL